MTTASPMVPGWASQNGHLSVGMPKAGLGVEELSERQLIGETLSRYVWAYDERDDAVLADCFTEDGVFVGSVAGDATVGPYEGREAVVAWLKGMMDIQSDQRRHCVMNVLIEDLTASSATVIAVLLLTGAENGVTRLITTGIYRVQLRRQERTWRIAHMFAGFDAAF